MPAARLPCSEPANPWRGTLWSTLESRQAWLSSTTCTSPAAALKGDVEGALEGIALGLGEAVE